MLTTEDKLKIYDLLTSKFNINEKYPLSAVGKELSMSRIRCRSYGFRHMKDLMAAMPEFCTLEEYEYEGHSNCNVTLHEWQDKPEPDQASKTYPSWFMANKPSSDNRKTSKEEDDLCENCDLPCESNPNMQKAAPVQEEESEEEALAIEMLKAVFSAVTDLIENGE